MLSQATKKSVMLRLEKQDDIKSIDNFLPGYINGLINPLIQKNYSKEDVETNEFSRDKDFSSKTFVLQSYKKSIKAACDAFNLICDAVLQDNSLEIENKKKLIEELKAYNNHLMEHSFRRLSTKNSIKDYQRVLLDYFQRLEFLSQRNFPDFKPKKLLEKADEYNVLTSPKPIVATVNFLKKDEHQKALYFVQIEIPEHPLSEAMIDEFLNAYPKSVKEPLWYKGMSREEKFLFDHTMRDVFAKKEGERRDAIRAKIKSISSRHRTIPGVANFSRHLSAIIDQGGNVIRLFPERYRSSMVASRDVNKMGLLTDDEKMLLRLNMTKANIVHIVETFVKNQINNPKTKNKYFTNGTVDLPKIKEYLESQPILLQTLISPTLNQGKKSLLQSAISSALKQPDTDLFIDKMAAFEALKNEMTIKIGNDSITFKPMIDQTNHPLNPAKYVNRTGTFLAVGDSKSAAQNLAIKSRASIKPLETLKELQERAKQNNEDLSLDTILEYLKQHEQNNAIVHATKDLSELLTHQGSLFDPNHREFQLAALEEFIVARLGLAHSTCVSGKDRRALAMMYADAMERYYDQYKKLPNYFDTGEDRKNFVKIFTDVFLTFHQQILSGLNAFGAEGIKNITLYLPNDILQNIKDVSGNPHIFEELDKLANNNESDKLLLGAGKVSEFHNKEFEREYLAYLNYSHDSTARMVHELAQSPLETQPKEEISDNEEKYIAPVVKKNIDELSKERLDRLKDIITSPLMNLQGEGFLGLPITPKGVKEMRNVLKNSGKKTSQLILHELSNIANTRLKIKQKHRAAIVVELYEILAGLNNEDKTQTNYWEQRLELLQKRVKGTKEKYGEEDIAFNILEKWEPTGTVNKEPPHLSHT